MLEPMDVLIRNADLIATVDDLRREIRNGWIALTGNLITGIGGPESVPTAAETSGAELIDAAGCLVSPGLINTHHHIYQNLTRAYLPATNGTLFQWLTTLYPVWSQLDEEAAYISAWI